MNSAASTTPPRAKPEIHDAWFAMRLSLLFGVLMLIGKLAAYFMTGSSAILADAAESIVTVGDAIKFIDKAQS